MIGLSLTASADTGIITIFQNGVIKHLPDPPLPFIDSAKVDASSKAYKYLEVGDGSFGLMSYATTMTLAATGPADRAIFQSWIPLGWRRKKVGFDTLYAAELTIDRWTKHRALCVSCLTASAAIFATVPLIIPEVRAALQRITGNGTQQENLFAYLAYNARRSA